MVLHRATTKHIPFFISPGNDLSFFITFILGIIWKLYISLSTVYWLQINCSCKRKIILTVPDTTRSVIRGDHVRQVTFAFKTKRGNKINQTKIHIKISRKTLPKEGNFTKSVLCQFKQYMYIRPWFLKLAFLNYTFKIIPCILLSSAIWAGSIKSSLSSNEIGRCLMHVYHFPKKIEVKLVCSQVNTSAFYQYKNVK